MEHRHPIQHHRRLLGCLAIAVLSSSACGVADDADYNGEAERLRSSARRIVDDVTREMSTQRVVSVSAIEQHLRNRVPQRPGGHLVKRSTDDARKAEVAFALDGKIDGYGPGRTTQTLRLCVLVSMTPPPTVTSSITDADCGDLDPAADSIVHYRS